MNRGEQGAFMVAIVVLIVLTALGCGREGGEGAETVLSLRPNLAYEFIHTYGLDAFFVARTRPVGEELKYTSTENLWFKPEGKDFEIFRCPKGCEFAEALSKGSFSEVQFGAMLPNYRSLLTTEYGTQLIYLGLIHATGTKMGFAAFRLNPHGLYIEAGAHNNLQDCLINPLLPADFDTSLHRYIIRHIGPFVLFFIDSKLVGVVVNAYDPDRVVPVFPPPPYAIFVAPCPISQRLSVFIGVEGKGRELSIPALPIKGFGASSSPPSAFSLDLYIYSTLQKMAGASVSGEVVSHPFPLLGLSSCQILFEANKPGTLYLDILARDGRWREFDSLAIPENVPIAYNPGAEALMGRIRFSPASSPATISVAEVSMKIRTRKGKRRRFSPRSLCAKN